MGKRILPYSSWVAPDFVPETFGRLTTISSKYRPEGHKNTLLDFRCSCGKKHTATVVNVLHGTTRSCGCLRLENKNRRTHGKTGTPEYMAWKAMNARCYKTNSKQYKDWGGRGIKVWDDWRGRQGFELWFAHMGPRPSEKHSVDRFPNPNGNYEPGNVRWATSEEQANNKRNNVYLSHEGRTQTLSQWARDYGLTATCLRDRLGGGMPMQEALTKKCDPYRNKKNSVWLEYKGVRKQMSQWATDLGIPARKLHNRRYNAIKQGHPWEAKVIEFIEKNPPQPEKCV